MPYISPQEIEAKFRELCALEGSVASDDGLRKAIARAVSRGLDWTHLLEKELKDLAAAMEKLTPPAPPAPPPTAESEPQPDLVKFRTADTSPGTPKAKTRKGK